MTKIVPITDLLPGGEATISAEAADVARALTEDIIFGRLAPGERLIEDNLIGRFGVTRHLVRQALQELVRTGIAVREKNKSVKVRSLTPREVRQIYEVREMLQRHAALLIQLPAPAPLIERLEADTRRIWPAPEGRQLQRRPCGQRCLSPDSVRRVRQRLPGGLHQALHVADAAGAREQDR